MKLKPYIIIFIFFYSPILYAQNIANENRTSVQYNSKYSFKDILTIEFSKGELSNQRIEVSTANSICRYFNDTLSLEYTASNGYVGCSFNVKITKNKYDLKAVQWGCSYKHKYKPISSTITLEKEKFDIDDSLRIYLKAFLIYEDVSKAYKDTLKMSGSLNFRIRNQAYSLEEQLKENRLFKFYEIANNHPDTITYLELGALDLEKIPSEIKKFINLKYLDLGENKIRVEEFDKISGLINLKELIISENQLSELPKAIFKLKNLEILIIEDNQITKIPKTISKLTKLRELYIENNHLVKFPKVLYKMSSLEYLFMEGNQINDYFTKIEKIKSIKGFN